MGEASAARFGGILLAGALAMALPDVGHAQANWPSQPLRIIVGFAPGSSPDLQARMVAPLLSQAVGQSVVVENKPGAAANIGADAVAKATDGHTIGIIGNGPLTSSQFLYPTLPYNPEKGFAPLALVGTAPLVWVVAKQPAGSTAQTFIDKARAQGDKMSYGSVGMGSGTNLGMELLKQALRIDPVHVPYNGGPAVLTALAGGQIQMALLPTSTVKPMIDAGKIEGIAVTSAKRSPLMPDLPGLEEIGAKGLNIEVWNAFMAPATMPAEHQARLSQALQKIMTSPEISEKMQKQGWHVGDVSPQALNARIAADRATYKAIITKSGIKLE